MKPTATQPSSPARKPFASVFLPTAFLLSLLLLTLGACAPQDGDLEGTSTVQDAAERKMVDDAHSFSQPWEVAVEHLALDLDVDFDARVMSGRASLHLDNKTGTDTLILDTRGLEIAGVTLDDGEETTFDLGAEEDGLGRPLTVLIRPETEVVHVDYSTTAGADAVQWLSPEQTTGGEHPFLFTQSQAILARTWVPLQDTPSVRFTYDATVRVPPELLALMSAENPTEKNDTGTYSFSMPQAIPSYLMALAVGDLEFRSLGEQSGVYAEPGVVAAAADEFAETPEMIDAAEELYGPYRWGQYDILVLPPAFPFGGMENPRLTFATPTILAGDRSLVALIAHELGHSWSGNLVTNADWDDFWLNEGFTVYVERRLMEELRGPQYVEMLASLGAQDLRATVEEKGADDPDTALHLDLADRDPDEGMTDVAYEKGYFFLRMLEESVGRERWDPFLRGWFDEHAFESVTSAQFVDYLEANLLEPAEIEPDSLRVDEWIYEPGLPANMPQVETERFAAVDNQAAEWMAEGIAASEMATGDWTTHEWLHFIRGLDDLSAEQMADLDEQFGFTDSGNAEIRAAWYLQAIEAGYEPAYPALEQFLKGMGRRKFLAPLYTALAETPEGRERALEIYREARPGYHSVSTGTIDEILDYQPAGG